MLKLRNSRGLSRNDMGILLGVSGTTVKRWEKGEALPTMIDIIHICNEFNISLEEVFEGQVNIDREVNRKLSKVDVGIESINSEISNLKDQLTLMRAEKANTNIADMDESDMTWIVLLIVHIVVTAVGFLCNVMFRMPYMIAFAFSIMYVVMISYLMIRKKENKKILKLFFLYSLFLEINMLLNYVLFADVTPGIINNIEIVSINGAMYGFRMIDLHNMELLLCICSTVYVSWIVFCGYHLIKGK
jgi:transcriptional regulator with XRE-family HTH domain